MIGPRRVIYCGIVCWAVIRRDGTYDVPFPTREEARRWWRAVR